MKAGNKAVKRHPRGPVFAFLSIRLKSGREKLSGLYRYANEHRLQVKVFDGITSERQLKTLLRIWNPAGCLVDSSFLRGDLSVKSFAGVPTVFQGLDPARAGRRAFLVQQDAAAVVALAAEELLSLGYPNSAYIGTRERFYWDEARRTSFRRRMKAAGAVPVEYDYGGIGLDTAAGMAKFKRFLSALPKPCAVLCAADYVAQSVIDVCGSVGIAVPGELAVAGVDDDELICENTNPKLTSVLPDFERGGYLAAELLDSMVSDPERAPELIEYGPRALVRRGSTAKRHADYRIARAEDFIQVHATEPITVGDVVAQMKCGRRFAERHFRKMTGQSVLERIRAERMEIAFRYLRDPRCAITAIPSLSGFSSPSYLNTIFRRMTGMTMREWRRANAR